MRDYNLPEVGMRERWYIKRNMFGVLTLCLQRRVGGHNEWKTLHSRMIMARPPIDPETYLCDKAEQILEDVDFNRHKFSKGPVE